MRDVASTVVEEIVVEGVTESTVVFKELEFDRKNEFWAFGTF